MSSSNRELQELDEIISYLTSSQSASVKQRPHLPGSGSQENLVMAGGSGHVYDEFSQDIFGMAPPPPAPLNQSDTESGVDSEYQRPATATQKLNSSLDELKLMLSAPQDVLPPPLAQAPSRNILKLAKSLDDLKSVELGYLDGEPSAEERQYDELRQRELGQLTHVIKFDEIVPSDFQDFDKLVNDLNTMMVKRNSHLGGSSYSYAKPSSVSNYREVGAPRTVNNQGAKINHDLNNDDTKPLVYTKLQLQENNSNSTSIDTTPLHSPESQASDETKEEKIRIAMLKLNEANIKKITIRIYIEDSRVFKTLVLTSLMSASDVIKELEKRFSLRDSPYWSLFEVLNDKRLERPLREYEIVTDVIKTWDVETSNALLVKQYKYRDSLTIKTAYEIPAAMHGWLYFEKKRDKWQKYFFELKPKGLFFAKDIKGTGEQMLCSSSSMEVYTMTLAPKGKAPSKFCFTVQSTVKEKSTMYSLCTDSVDKIKDWVLSIRNAKVYHCMGLFSYNKLQPNNLYCVLL